MAIQNESVHQREIFFVIIFNEKQISNFYFDGSRKYHIHIHQSEKNKEAKKISDFSVRRNNGSEYSIKIFGVICESEQNKKLFFDGWKRKRDLIILKLKGEKGWCHHQQIFYELWWIHWFSVIECLICFFYHWIGMWNPYIVRDCIQ